MRIRKVFLAASLASCLLLAGCPGAGIPVPQTTPQTIYALDETYASATVLAVAYIQKPGADQAVVGQLKYYSGAAHDALVQASQAEATGGGNAGVGLAAANAAIKAFQDYLNKNGIK